MDSTEPAHYAMMGGKRKHNEVFAQAYASLHNRERQVDPHFSDKAAPLDALDESKRWIKRASGNYFPISFNMFHASDNKYPYN